MVRKVDVSPYNAEWISMFEEEANKLRDFFGQILVDIYHIGSTSVPGLAAKTVIDIMPVVEDIRMVDEHRNEMISIGYEPKGENGIAGRRYFQKGGDDRTHHVHIYQIDSPEIERHLAFRDYLRSHTDVANKYGQLKQQLAQQFPYDIESYIKGKESLAEEIEQQALVWYRMKQKK